MVTRSSGYTRLFLTAPVVLAVALPEALAQDASTSPAPAYPNRPIRIVVAIPSGSGTDTVARLIAQGLSERLGRQVVVENRPGAGTIIGNEIVAKAKPDGYTLLMNGAALTISPAMYKKIPYDTVHDFAPITVAVFTPNLMAVHPSVPAKSVQEMIALAKARPGELSYGSSGNGSTGHFAAELFNQKAGLKMLHVPYKGNAQALVDIIAGQVMMMYDQVSTSAPYVKAGKLKALAVTSTTRSSLFPGVPTVDEAGVKGYEAITFNGLLAPAGTPREVLARLQGEVAKAVAVPAMRSNFLERGVELTASSSPDEFTAYIRNEVAANAKLARNAGIKAQ